MKCENDRRAFLKKLTISGIGLTAAPPVLLSHKAGPALQEEKTEKMEADKPGREYNGSYRDEYLSRLAFPIGGIGSGMFCLEGTGALSHMSVRNRPELFHEPVMFPALSVKGVKNGAKVIEGPVSDWKIFGKPGSGNGDTGRLYGLPRFNQSVFSARFPFCHIHLQHEDIPLNVQIMGWSPFIPTDADNSSLPVGAVEYRFSNRGKETRDAVFSYHAKNFMLQYGGKGTIGKIKNGFILSQFPKKDKPSFQGDFAVYTDSDDTVVDYCWHHGVWWDPLVEVWDVIRKGQVRSSDPVDADAPGASLYIPFRLLPGEEKTIRLLMAWYVPDSDLRIGEDVSDAKSNCDPASGCCSFPADAGLGGGDDHYRSLYYKPWYSRRFANIDEATQYWSENYKKLYLNTQLFSDAFYACTHPPEVMEAVAANLTILKSPTVLRQPDGRLWCFEGCADNEGCCSGSCTHVWNYAQAIPHLFPSLERTLRHTEFCEDQDPKGRQMFRAGLPIRPIDIKKVFFIDAMPAADGQLGGIMKVYREWRIGGDDTWLRKMYPMVKKSMDFCIRTWDPHRKGFLEQAHHTTYDIGFLGPDAMCTGIYLGALQAIVLMGEFLQQETSGYKRLYEAGKKYIENELFNGEYFIQGIQDKLLHADEQKLVNQYGGGCLSDGVLGSWLAAMCSMDYPVDKEKIKSHLLSVYRYNFKKDLSEHVNTGRPSYALGHEGGLLLCSWPDGKKPAHPFGYSSEVWTGIEYEVASYLIMTDHVEQGLEIVRACRSRYDGRIRNPFNEYECGSWYGRAMSSYGLLQALTGLRYDAVEKTLYIDPVVDDFTSFLSTASGFGTVSLMEDKPSLKVYYGTIPVKKAILKEKSVQLTLV